MVPARRTVVYIFTLLMILSCKKDPNLIEINNLSDNKVMVYGHGGMGYRSGLPMNSSASLCECLASGADGVEMDVQMSRDSVLYLYHDGDLKDATDCSGKIDELSSGEIDGCLYKRDRKRHPLVRASTFFDACGNHEGKKYVLECKLGRSDFHVYARALFSFIQKHSLSNRCLIESVEPAFLSILESADPSLETYFYCKRVDDAILLRDTLPIDGLTISMDLISAAKVQAAHREGLKVTVFSAATEKENVNALMLSPDNIQTDNVPYLVDLCRKIEAE